MSGDIDADRARKDAESRELARNTVEYEQNRVEEAVEPFVSTARVSAGGAYEVERRHKRSMSVFLQVWSYTGIVMLVGIVICVLAGDFVLLFPIGVLSLCVGTVGTLRVVFKHENIDGHSIFR